MLVTYLFWKPLNGLFQYRKDGYWLTAYLRLAMSNIRKSSQRRIWNNTGISIIPEGILLFIKKKVGEPLVANQNVLEMFWNPSFDKQKLIELLYASKKVSKNFLLHLKHLKQSWCNVVPGKRLCRRSLVKVWNWIHHNSWIMHYFTVIGRVSFVYRQ